MKITEIDKNFETSSALIPKDAVWYDVKSEPFSIHGLWQREKGEYFLRMPPKVAEATNEGVIQLNYCTAGGRVRFKTNSPYLAIKAIMPYCDRMSHITPLGQSGFDLYKSDAGSYAYAASFPRALPQTSLTATVSLTANCTRIRSICPFTTESRSFTLQCHPARISVHPRTTLR